MTQIVCMAASLVYVSLIAFAWTEIIMRPKDKRSKMYDMIEAFFSPIHWLLSKNKRL